MNAPTTIIPAGTAPFRVLLSQRNALSDRLNEGAWTDEAAAVVCDDIDRLEAAIINHPAATADDAIVKLVTLAQIAASEREIDDHEAVSVIADAQRHFGLGWLDPAHAVLVNPAPPVATDEPILNAYAARRREFEENYHLDMTPEDEGGYFRRIDACEAVIHGTPATTIAGVLAKLRVTFVHQTGELWSDRAIDDPTHPVFVEGLATAGTFAHQAWSAIEDLARIGGIDLATQGQTVTGLVPFEALRLEYLAHDHQVKTTITDADTDPRFATMQARMKQIEQEVVTRPCQSAADAKTKMRFMLDTASVGIPLDGEEAHVLIKDAARFLIGEEAGA
jgi:hypothetical protein